MIETVELTIFLLSIDVLLEDPNLGYSLDKFDADLTRDKIQSTDTAITVWL